jgi:hypothetical protein
MNRRRGGRKSRERIQEEGKKEERAGKENKKRGMEKERAGKEYQKEQGGMTRRERILED